MAGRAYGGLTAEQRQGERRQRLVDAAADLIRERGVNGTSYRAVCRASGLTERYFYESFGHLDELLLAVFEEEVQAALGEVIAAVAQAEDPRQGMRAGVIAFVERFARERLLSRLVVESPAHPALRILRDRWFETFVETMIQQAYPVVGAPKDPREERQARHTAVMLVGGFNELLSQWVQAGCIELGSEIADDVVELFTAAMMHFSARDLR